MAKLIKQVSEFRDINYLFSRNPVSGNFNIKKDREAIKQSIRNILLTRKGERPFSPSFGSPIYDYLFENLTFFMVVALKSEIQQAIETYEPRVTVQNVTVQYDNQHSILVKTDVLIINSSESFEITVLVDRLR